MSTILAVLTFRGGGGVGGGTQRVPGRPHAPPQREFVKSANIVMRSAGGDRSGRRAALSAALPHGSIAGRYRMLRLRIVILTLLAASALLPLPAATAARRERCFPETGQCISGAIRAYWERNGGLPVFGYPITAVFRDQVEGTWNGPVQWFERDRLEDHSADAQGVLAGRLGAWMLELQDRPWQDLPRVDQAPAGCRYFAVTGHSLCGAFLRAWEMNGGLQRFGYPLTEP